MTKRNHSKNADYFLPNKKQKQLSLEAKDIQNLLPNDMKSIILKQDKNLGLEKLACKDSDSSKKLVESKITKKMLYDLLRSLDNNQNNDYNS